MLFTILFHEFFPPWYLLVNRELHKTIDSISAVRILQLFVQTWILLVNYKFDLLSTLNSLCYLVGRGKILVNSRENISKSLLNYSAKQLYSV
jgi:hypothetical protein